MLSQVQSSFRVLGGTLLCLFFTGCSSTWVVSSDLEGGVIGYSGFSESEEALAEISKKVQCPYGFVGVADDLKSAPYTYTTYQTVSAYGQTRHYGRRGYSTTSDTYHVLVPVTQTGTRNWREYRYQCRRTPEGVSSSPVIKSVKPSAE